MIETIIHEEHHDAFPIWHYALSKGLIDRKLNCLVHIDSHDDFLCPVTDVDINQLSEDLENIDNYAYWQLTISNFITPALYKKIFNEFFWLTPDHKGDKKIEEYYIRTLNEGGKHFIMGKYNPFHTLNYPWHDRVRFLYTKASADSIISPKQKVVLDIDLDYFSCNKKPEVDICVEVTRDEYYRIKSNRYHPLRLENKISLISKGNSYWLEQKSRAITSGSKLRPEGIRKRIQMLCDFLVKNKIKPSFINICRSVKSGYTPKDQSVFIEDNLVEMLEKLYGISIRFW